MIINEANRGSSIHNRFSKKASRVTIKGYRCYREKSGRQNVFIKSTLKAHVIKETSVGQLINVNDLLLLALYSPSEHAETIERFDDITNIITDQQMVSQIRRWAICGDWNADYDKCFKRYE